MASTGNSNNINPNPWGSPYDSYRDCSKGICSIYCPQWCYTVYPPPPPFDLDADSGTDFSPLIIAVIGILASAFVLVFYYTVISRYCRGRSNTGVDFNQDRDLINGDQGWNNNNNVGLDDAVIKSITVFKYKKNDGLIDGTDCSVCLSEFQEDDSLRLLPKCSHAFHLPCIDTWLKSHSSCPLCRANINLLNHTTGISIQTGNSGSSVHRYQHQNEVVSVIEDVESGGAVRSDAVVNIVLNDDVPKNPVERESEADDRQIRRSMSLNSSLSSSSSGSSNTNNRGSVLLVADILRSNEDGEEGGGDGDSTVEKNYRSRVMNMVRSVSTGRFMFGSRYGKGGNSSVIPQ